MIKTAKIIPGGQALATDKAGKKIFFWNALPGETIASYKVTKEKSHFTEAIATNISEPSPSRTEPKDTCFLSTSPWQIMNYDYELRLKTELVVELFREHQITIPLPKIFTDGKEFFYRNKMEYALYWNHATNQIEPAFHMRGSHSKIPISHSSIERPELFERAQQIIKELNDEKEEARKYQSLLLRCNQKGDISGGLFENGKPHPHFPNLTDTILGHEFSYSPNGFFQINLPVYEMALTEIKRHINTKKVLDLYAGVGTIGLSVARDHHLTLVECDKSAFNEMTKNITVEGVAERSDASISSFSSMSKGENDAARNGNILGLFAKSETALDYVTGDATVILDPPRAGCDSKLINRLLEVTPPIIIYLSCNPATQARDVKALLEKYHIKEMKVFNFFPHTPHIENLVVLSL